MALVFLVLLSALVSSVAPTRERSLRFTAFTLPSSPTASLPINLPAISAATYPFTIDLSFQLDSVAVGGWNGFLILGFASMGGEMREGELLPVSGQSSCTLLPAIDLSTWYQLSISVTNSSPPELKRALNREIISACTSHALPQA